MSFEPRKNKIEQVLKENLAEQPTRRVGRKPGKTKHPYQFTLTPKNREKLDKIAEKSGYTSVSQFLDNWIEQYEI